MPKDKSIILYLVALQAELKMHHWLTRSYARHRITHKLIKHLSPLVDRFIELYITSANINTVTNVINEPVTKNTSSSRKAQAQNVNAGNSSTGIIRNNVTGSGNTANLNYTNTEGRVAASTYDRYPNPFAPSPSSVMTPQVSPIDRVFTGGNDSVRSALPSSTLNLKLRVIMDDDSVKFQTLLVEFQRAMSEGGEIDTVARDNPALAAMRDEMATHVSQALYLLRMGP